MIPSVADLTPAPFSSDILSFIYLVSNTLLPYHVKYLLERNNIPGFAFYG